MADNAKVLDTPNELNDFHFHDYSLTENNKDIEYSKHILRPNSSNLPPFLNSILTGI